MTTKTTSQIINALVCSNTLSTEREQKPNCAHCPYHFDEEVKYKGELLALSGCDHDKICKDAAERLKALIDIEQPSDKCGHWEGTADGYADGEPVYDRWACSKCGYDADGADEPPDWNYCPNCGAKMEGVAYT